MTDPVPAAAPPSIYDILKPFAASALRHALTVGAGILVAHSWVSGSGAEQLVATGMGVGALAWSWWQKSGHVQLAQDVANLSALLQAKADAARAQRTPTASGGGGAPMVLGGGGGAAGSGVTQAKRP